MAYLDLVITKSLILMQISPILSKIIATASGLIFNFMGRRYFVFPEAKSGPWKPQEGSG